jgi:hypothetical protein
LFPLDPLPDLHRKTRRIFIVHQVPSISREAGVIVFVDKLLAIAHLAERVEPGTVHIAETVDIVDGIPVHRDLFDGEQSSSITT